MKRGQTWKIRSIIVGIPGKHSVYESSNTVRNQL